MSNTVLNVEANFIILLLRNRILDIKSNLQCKHSYLSCPVCDSQQDAQQNAIIKKIAEYYDLLGAKLDSKIMISRQTYQGQIP